MVMPSGGEFSLVKKFAERTVVNLNVIIKLRSEILEAERSEAKGLESAELEFDEVFEVTQLLNSCLGLLVFPHEKFQRSIDSVYEKDFEKRGWPKPKPAKGHTAGASVGDSSEMIRLIRNAFAHCRLELVPDEEKKGEIGGLILWDLDDKTRKEVWAASFTIEDIRKLAQKVLEEVLDERNLKISELPRA